MNTQVSALRFFLKITLGRLDLAHQLARVDYPRKLPRVLSPADVARLLEAAPGPGLKYNVNRLAKGTPGGILLFGSAASSFRPGPCDC